MVQTLLWQLLFFLLRIALGVTKDMVLATIKAVTEAEEKKHEDGTPLTGPEKRSYVLTELISAWSNEDWAKIVKEQTQSTVNLLVEAAVSYMKGLKK
jgi:hypothetical protein